MLKRKIYFRADANATIGYGHFVRTLALADMLKNDFDCTFLTSSPSAYQIEEMGKVCNHISLNEETKFEDFINLLEGDEIVVLDNYFYTTEYQKQIKEKGCKLVCVDDMHDKHYYADVVINHGLTDASLFDVEPYTRLCLGFNYALLRTPFLQETEISRKQNSWFISFGGTDFLNLTEKALQAIHGDPRVDTIIIVIGDAYLYKENLCNYPNIVLKKNLSAGEMASLMRQSEYAILPSSSVCIEALACGCKVAAGYFVDNQQPYHDEWSRNHYIMGLGSITEKIETDIISQLQGNDLHVDAVFHDVASRYVDVFKQL